VIIIIFCGVWDVAPNDDCDGDEVNVMFLVNEQVKYDFNCVIDVSHSSIVSPRRICKNPIYEDGIDDTPVSLLWMVLLDDDDVVVVDDDGSSCTVSSST
jgi:hypothetical protein